METRRVQMSCSTLFLFFCLINLATSASKDQPLDQMEALESKKMIEIDDDLLKAESQEVSQEHRESVSESFPVPIIQPTFNPTHAQLQRSSQPQPQHQSHHHYHQHQAMNPLQHQMQRFAPQFLRKLPQSNGPVNANNAPPSMNPSNLMKSVYPKPSPAMFTGPLLQHPPGQPQLAALYTPMHNQPNQPNAAQLLAAAAPGSNLLHSNLLPAHLLQDGSIELNELGAPLLELARQNGPVNPPASHPNGPVQQPPSGHGTSSPSSAGQNVPTALANNWPADTVAPGSGNNLPVPAASDKPKISHLDVKCEKNLMRVAIEFDRPFHGVVFSKGHFNQQHCVHLSPNSGRTQAQFDILIGQCGTTGNTQNGLYGYGAASGSGTYFENTIVVQYDAQVQEAWDTARKLRCTWHDQYEKAVAFRPFPVDMLDVVKADFAGDNVGCWMQIQVGRGPWASEVAGIVKIGQTMTMVLAIKDEENKFDMLVRNCIAHDGERAPIELVDANGCISRPKLMSRFTKIKNFGNSATVLSYAHFQAFKFPDSMEVHFQCTIQICRFKCPDQCTRPSPANGFQSEASAPHHVVVTGKMDQRGGSVEHVESTVNAEPHRNAEAGGSESSINRRLVRRSISNEPSLASLSKEVGLNKMIQVVSSGDLAFSTDKLEASENVNGGDLEESDQQSVSMVDARPMVCIRSLHLLAALACLLVVLVFSICGAVAMFVRTRQLQLKTRATGSASSMLSSKLYSLESRGSTLQMQSYARK